MWKWLCTVNILPVVDKSSYDFLLKKQLNSDQTDELMDQSELDQDQRDSG